MPRKTDANNPADWVLISQSDLEGLRQLAQAELSYSMCRSKLAEVLEKVLKAELLRLGWSLLKTHDVLVLAKELETRGSDLMTGVKPLATALAGPSPTNQLTTPDAHLAVDNPHRRYSAWFGVIARWLSVILAGRLAELPASALENSWRSKPEFLLRRLR